MITDSAAELKWMSLNGVFLHIRNISITNMNGEDSSDASHNNFVSTVSIMMMSLALQMHH